MTWRSYLMAVALAALLHAATPVTARVHPGHGSKVVIGTLKEVLRDAIVIETRDAGRGERDPDQGARAASARRPFPDRQGAPTVARWHGRATGYGVGRLGGRRSWWTDPEGDRGQVHQAEEVVATLVVAVLITG